MNTEILTLRIPDSLAEALRSEKARTGCSTSEFVRRTLTAALNLEPTTAAHTLVAENEPMHNWIKIAAELFPTATRILGDGRWAVANGDVVYLCQTEQQQRHVSLGIGAPVKKDLLYPTTPVPTNCPDFGYRDRD